MKQFLLIGLLFPLVAGAQLIRRSGLDQAKKEWVVESAPVVLKSAAETKMEASLRSADTAITLQLSGSGAGASTVLAGDEVIFLFDDDSTIAVASPSLQPFDRGRDANTYRHDYPLSVPVLEMLGRHNLQGLRKYSTAGYDDVYPDKATDGRLKELSRAFLAELKKGSVLAKTRPTAPAGFPGGKDVLLRFLNRNLKLPQALQTGERRFALVRFRVSADGSVEDLAIAQSAGAGFDDELLRILRRMPKWKPARENGKQVAATLSHPFTFVQTESETKILF